MVHLVEPFLDFPVVIQSHVSEKDKQGKTKRDARGRRIIKYRRWCLLAPETYPLNITLDDLREAVEELQEKYPTKDYRLEERTLFYSTYHVLRRGKVSPKNPPIYFLIVEVLDEETDETEERLKMFVPSSYVDRKKRLVNSVVHYRMMSLKIPLRMVYINWKVKRSLHKLYPIDSYDYIDLIARLAELRETLE